MKSRLLTLIVACLPATIWAANYFEQTFSSEEDLLDMTLEYDSPVTLTSSFYRNLPTLPMEARWFVSRVGNHGYCALYGSHTGDNANGAARMISPAIEVGDNAGVRWSARSLLPVLSEAYAVLVREANSEEWNTLYATENESDRWQDHCVSLKDWKGKTVEVAIECRSKDAYLLAIDDLKIGELAETELSGKHNIPVFHTPGEKTFEFEIQNLGKPYECVGARLYMDDELVSDITLEHRIDVAENLTIEMPASLKSGQVSKYKFALLDAAGNETTLCTGSWACNDYEKRLLIDKATGTWCVNCPLGDLAIANLGDIYGDQMIVASTHTGDIMSNTGYFSGLGFSSAPFFTINRIPDFNSEQDKLKSNMTQALDLPTNIGISATANVEGNNVLMNARVETSGFRDNANGNIRVGCVLIGDVTDIPAADARLYQQRNASVSSSSGDYLYYLPDVIPGNLWKYDHVTLSSETAFEGIQESLPKVLNAGETYKVDYVLAMPEKAATAQNLALIAFVIDASTGEIYNSCIVRDIESNAGVNDVLVDESTFERWYTIQGLPVDKPSHPGIYIQCKGSVKRKIIKR